MAFRVGQKVVCVDAGPCPAWGVLTLKRNAIYTVAKVIEYGGEAGLVLAEDTSPHLTGAYRSSRFRPAVERKTDISIFTSMLTGSPVRENA